MQLHDILLLRTSASLHSVSVGAKPLSTGQCAPTETECRLAEVRSRSMSCNCMTRTSQQECRGIFELLIKVLNRRTVFSCLSISAF